MLFELRLEQADFVAYLTNKLLMRMLGKICALIFSFLMIFKQYPHGATPFSCTS